MVPAGAVGVEKSGTAGIWHWPASCTEGVQIDKRPDFAPARPAFSTVHGVGQNVEIAASVRTFSR